MRKNNVTRTLPAIILFSLLLLATLCAREQGTGADATVGGAADTASSEAFWSQKPPAQWPHITMINQIDYTDKHHPVAGCGFLLDTGEDTLAVTAKHILTYFKSEPMTSVDFQGTLKSWKMFPKDNPAEVVTTPNAARARYDAGSDVGYGIVP